MSEEPDNTPPDIDPLVQRDIRIAADLIFCKMAALTLVHNLIGRSPPDKMQETADQILEQYRVLLNSHVQVDEKDAWFLHRCVEVNCRAAVAPFIKPVENENPDQSPEPQEAGQPDDGGSQSTAPATDNIVQFPSAGEARPGDGAPDAGNVQA